MAHHANYDPERMKRLIVAGGGLAGCLSALALARRRPEVEVLLIEEGESFGGNHTWSFFDTDVTPDARWVLDGIEAHHWPEHVVRFPKRQRKIEIGYNSISSAALDLAVRKAIREDQFRLGQRVTSVAPNSVTLQSGERLEASAVLDARGPGTMPGLDLGWQKFVGRTYRFAANHGVEAPVIMDATVEQIDGYRFVYQLPLSESEILIEDTYYSASPLLDEEAIASRVDAAARALGEGTCIAEEKGVLPVVMGGEIRSFWAGEPVARLGLRGGFFHPTTSYSLPDAVANAALLARQADLGSAALHGLFRGRAARLWRDRRFYRLLNRMLFRAAAPDESYRVLEHFYRLPAALIARFYGARLTTLDKIRILSGRPPVPLAKAIGALRRRAA
jgi:lycopene beta-cyclase